MIDKNSLRLGNLVQTKERGICEIICLFEILAWISPIENNPNHTTLSAQYIHIDGIELTEDWLLKFKFISDNYGVFYKTKDNKNNSYNIVQLWAKKCIVEDETTTFDIHVGENFGNTSHVCYIDFVHQLQNIFYFINNKELIKNRAE